MNHIRRSFNQVTVVGRIADNFKLTKDENGVFTVYLTINTESLIKIDDVKKEKITKIPVILFGQSALFVDENAEIGTRMFIVGVIDNVTYKSESVNFYDATVVVGEHVQIMSPYKLRPSVL